MSPIVSPGFRALGLTNDRAVTGDAGAALGFAAAAIAPAPAKPASSRNSLRVLMTRLDQKAPGFCYCTSQAAPEPSAFPSEARGGPLAESCLRAAAPLTRAQAWQL